MKRHLLVLFVLFLSAAFCFVRAKDDKDFFRRHAETAHPVPDPDFMIPQNQKSEPEIPLSNEPTIPLFINSNMIEEEVQTNNPIQNESSIAVNFTNPKNLIGSAVDYRDTSAAWVYVSSDGGRSWKNIKLGRPHKGWVSSNDPSVAFNTSGTGYMVYGGFYTDTTVKPREDGSNGLWLARTTDEGKTWQAHIPIKEHRGVQTKDSTFEDKYYIQVDNSTSSPYFNHLYVPWKQVTARDSATQIVISKSTDNGSTWSTPLPISPRLSGTSEDTTYGQSFPLAITGPKGEVYVIWNNGIEHGVGFAKSLDGGATYSAPKIIERYNIFGVTQFLEGQNGWRHSLKGKVRAETYPSMVCDITNGKNRGNLYLTWAGDKVPNIYFSRSTDGGDSWSKPVIIHSDTTNDQFWQWISLDPLSGDIAVMYLDSRNDKSNIRVECYVSYSSDGGLTWTDRRASDINGDMRKNPFVGNSFAGDYSGNAFYNGIIFPSWIDFRNAEKNSIDDDVYTAIVNTRAPAPPENFVAKPIADELAQIALSWKAPKERTFGQALNASNFKYALYRDGTFITEIPGSDESYTDNGLTPHKQYHYSIIAVAASDSSIAVIDSAFAGGAKRPAAPVLVAANGNSDNKVSLSVKLPSFREDNTTLLSNLKTINIFRDSVKISSVNVQKSDTGRVIEFNDNPPVKGYYTYAVSASDEESPSNESGISNSATIYTGPVDITFEENFSSPTTAKYINVGGWAPTDKFYYSPSYSLTESPNGNYNNNATYEFTLFPVRNAGTPSMQIEFRHAAIVEPKDTAFVEYSKDKGASWTAAATFNMSSFTAWQDKALTAEDWKPETITVSSDAKDTLAFRFRLKSGTLKNDDGWYIDDIKISGSTPVEEIAGDAKGFSVYPNPASGKVYIHLDQPDMIESGSFSVFNLYGAPALDAEPEIAGSSDISLDVSTLPQGVYIIRFVSASGMKKEAMFSVVR